MQLLLSGLYYGTALPRLSAVGLRPNYMPIIQATALNPCIGDFA